MVTSGSQEKRGRRPTEKMAGGYKGAQAHKKHNNGRQGKREGRGEEGGTTQCVFFSVYEKPAKRGPKGRREPTKEKEAL